MLTKDFIAYDDYTSTLWVDEDGAWVQIESRSPWESCFVLFPRKSYFSKERLWGSCYKRGTKFMIKGTTGPAPRSTEYASQFEVFTDKLAGAL
mgnify:CR=1 FL=1